MGSDILWDATALPVELLVEIFAVNKDPAFLMTLAAVCRSWKDVIYDEPLLWTRICVTTHTTMAQLCAQLALSSSRSLDIDISFVPSDSSDSESFVPSDISDNLIEILHTVLDEHGRVERLKIDISRTWDDDVENDEQWPEQIPDALTGGKSWPHLRTLALNAEGFIGIAFNIHIVAPQLEALLLEHVSNTSWKSIGLGPALREIDLSKSVNLRGFWDALRNCPNLRRLHLNDETESFEPLRLGGPRTRDLVLANFVDLCIFWESVDVPTFLQFLACCPNLERLYIHVTAFENHDTVRHATNFQLKHLKVLHLASTAAGERWQDILCVLSPAISASKLVEMELDGVNLHGCEGIFGPSLLRIQLNNISDDASHFVRALCQCQQLASLRLVYIRLASLDEVEFNNNEALAALRSAALVTSTPDDSDEEPSDISMTVDDRRLLRLFLSLVVIPGIPSLELSGIPLAMRDVAHVSAEILGGGILLVDLSHSLVGRAVFKLNGEAGVMREFEVGSAAEALGMLESTYGVFANIAALTLDIAQAVDFFGVLPAAASLPCLIRLALRSGWDMYRHPDIFTSSLSRVIDLRADKRIDCRFLSEVALDCSEDEGVRISKSLVDRFLDVFQLVQPVKLQVHNVFLVPDETTLE